MGAAVLLALPGAALAADTFVNDATGNDGNTCLSAATACKTIGGGISKAGSDNTIRVAPGSYDEQVALGDGKSLRGTGPAEQTIIDPVSGNSNTPTIHVTGSAGTIQGFTIRGFGEFFRGMLHLEAPATVTGNVFDGDDEVGSQPASVVIAFGAGSPTVTGNTFFDDGAESQIAIANRSTGSPVISDNDIDGFFHGIDAIAGTPTIRGNEIIGAHNSATSGVGHAIQASSSTSSNVTATVVENFVHDPVTDGGGQQPNGISVQDADPVGIASATLRRNRVVGHSTGIRILNTDGPVTLDSDLVTGASPYGISSIDTTNTNGPGDVTATNVTAFGNAFDITLQDTHLTLNSSVVDDAIRAEGPNLAHTCSITFSRGHDMVPGGNGCQGFQTTDSPQFVNAPGDPGADDFHLQSTSPMIDAGDTAAPPGDATDVDGDPRALDGNVDCTLTVRRDIGADEYRPPSPGTTINTGPTSGSAIGDSTPAFSFSSDGPAACTTFECRVDGGSFAACGSPHTTAALSDGPHTFRVRAIATDASQPGDPSSRSFTVDTKAPQTAVTDGPGALTDDPTPSFRFSSSEAGSSFQCRVDGGPFTGCASPRTTSRLDDGDHRFQVRARDKAANLDATPAGRSFTVDTRAPETTITKAPKRKVKTKKRKKKVVFEFTSDEPASFECSLDGEAFQPCTSPVREKVKKGMHDFEVRGTDEAGNQGASDSHTWKVKRKKKRR